MVLGGLAAGLTQTGGVPLYADLPARRTRQLVGDAGCLLVVVASVLAGQAVHAAVAGVADPARRFADGSTALADGLRSTGGSLGAPRSSGTTWRGCWTARPTAPRPWPGPPGSSATPCCTWRPSSGC